MNKKYYSFRRTVDKLLVWEKYYCIVLMLVMLMIAFVQVILRYVFNSPLMWSDEIILVMLAWFAFPALTFNIWADNHFNISSVYDKFPPKVRKVCDIGRHVLVGMYLAILTYYGAVLVDQYWSKPLSASGLPQGIKYIPVVIGPGISVIFCVVNLIGVFVGPEKKGEEA